MPAPTRRCMSSALTSLAAATRNLEIQQRRNIQVESDDDEEGELQDRQPICSQVDASGDTLPLPQNPPHNPCPPVQRPRESQIDEARSSQAPSSTSAARSTRGRVLQGLASSVQARQVASESIQPQPQVHVASEPPAQTPQPATTSSANRGLRGRALQGLAAAAAAQSRQQPTTSATPNNGTATISRMSAVATLSQTSPSSHGNVRTKSPRSSSSDSSPTRAPLSRQGSDLSSNSVVSQQFAPPLSANIYKANLPKIPSQVGRPIKVATNYLRFDCQTGKSVEEYHVDFVPNIESIKLRFKVLRLPEAEQIIGKVMHWSGTNLYLPVRLLDDVTSFTSTHPITQEQIKVKLTHTRSPSSDELVAFYNGLMRKAMHSLKMFLINRNYYSPVGRITIQQHQIEVWPGWVTSIQRLDGGVLLSIDASFRILRMQTAYDVLKAIYQRNPSNFKAAAECALVGATVLTKYNNKAYRIDEIDFSRKASDTFTFDRPGGVSQQISYVEYLKTHWNIDIREPSQSLLIHRPRFKREHENEFICLVPEVCLLTGITDEMRQDFNVMRDVAEHTRLRPDVREKKMSEFVHELKTNEKAKKIFEDWNLNISERPEIVDARKHDSQLIMLGDDRQVTVPENTDWTRYATTGKAYRAVDLTTWVLVYCERDSSIASCFLDMLSVVVRDLGMKLSAPRQVKLANEQTKFYLNELKNNVKVTDQLVIVLTPGKTQREDRYSACKNLLSCDVPVPSQFIRCGTLSNPKRLKSIVQKVALQILCKVGGQPWAMRFAMKSFMIVGIDVYHDTLDKKRSCVGFVASMNTTCSQWWSKVFFQHTMEEVTAKLKLVLIEALQKYYQHNNSYPDRIIVYRDGVGDGQMDAVLNIEVAQLVESVHFFIRNSTPRTDIPGMSYVIVNKKINSKLILKSSMGPTNPNPGSYLDHTITHPNYNDFLLVSQHVTQGTVSPTKYVVLTETGTLKIEHHSKLAYMMCHMYMNWTGTIKVPAPCQYAHKLAYLAGQSIRAEPSQTLDDKLYYL